MDSDAQTWKAAQDTRVRAADVHEWAGVVQSRAELALAEGAEPVAWGVVTDAASGWEAHALLRSVFASFCAAVRRGTLPVCGYS